MKRIAFTLLIALSVCHFAQSQNVGINSSGATPDASAMLDVSSTSKGLLIPRVALTATNAAGPLSSPATSLLVYNTATAGTSPNNVVPGYYYWNGTAWVALLSASNTGWSLTGNSGTDDATNFIGTTDAMDLVLKGNNIERARIAGNATSTAALLVDAGTEDLQTAIDVSGDINNYLEVNIQNISNGTLASSDLVATANNGTGSSVYVDLGINSQGYSNGACPTCILNGPNLGYLYSNARDFKIGNGAPNYDLVFFTNPNGGTPSTTSANGVERMRIKQSGFVGVGTDAPTSTLSVGGSVSHALRSAGTAYTITSTDNVVIHTGSTARTWTLPAASTCTGRIYYLVNHSASTNITLTEAVRLASGSTTTTLGSTAGSNAFTIVSDGTEWVKIN